MPRPASFAPPACPAAAPLTRRSWLRRVLLAAAALRHTPLSRLGLTASAVVPAACRPGASGMLLGPNVKLGHQLRDATFATPPAAVRAQTDVVIIGGGPSGLSAAWELRRRGVHDLLILELEPRVGGTSVWREQGVVPAPWGAHYVPVPRAHNVDLVALLDEMGVLQSLSPPRGKERALVRAPEERLFAEGRYHLGLFPSALASAEDGRQFVRFNAEMAKLAQARDANGRRAFTVPMALCSNDPQFTRWDQHSAAEWLADRGYTSELLLWNVRYACRDDYGLEPEQTSAWAMLFYFVSRLDDEGLESAPFLSWPEGNGALVRHLTERVGNERILTQTLVSNVRSNHGAVTVDYYDAARNEARVIEAKQAIVAVPRFIASRIVAPLRDEPRLAQAAQDFSYSSWMVANLELTGRPRSVGVDVAWDSVIYDGKGLGFVDAQHQRLRDRGPTVWTYYRPLSELPPAAARQLLLDASHEELARQVIEDIELAHPDLSRYLGRVDVWRWGHAMIRPTPGFIWGESRRTASESQGPIHFAHSDMSGLALFEEAFYRGVAAARKVTAARESGAL